MFLHRHAQLSKSKQVFAHVFQGVNAVYDPLRHKNRNIHTRNFVTPVPPVPQNVAGSKGPTAIVFLNMGGPSTVDEVGDFLRRLFVCHRIFHGLMTLVLTIE